MNDLNGDDIEDLSVGMSATFSKNHHRGRKVPQTTCRVQGVQVIDGKALATR